MTERYRNHPRLLDEEGRKLLPPNIWHPKITGRYPIGSPAELHRRANRVYFENLAMAQGRPLEAGVSPIQPHPALLDTIEAPVDIVAAAIVLPSTNSAILILEDHVHKKDPPYSLGKSTILQNLLNLPLPHQTIRERLAMTNYEKLTPEILLKKMRGIGILAFGSYPPSPFKLLSGDVTYIGKSKNELVALATTGVEYDFAVDISRSTVRNLFIKYEHGNINIKRVQLELVDRLKIDDSLWTPSNRSYPIRSLIFLTEDPALEENAAWAKTKTNDQTEDLRQQLLNNPLYLSPQTSNWEVEPEFHRKRVNELFQEPVPVIPDLNYLVLRNPRDPVVLSDAARLIRTRLLA